MRSLVGLIVLIAISLGIGASVADAVNVRVTLLRNPDNTFDTAYPTGNKPPDVETLEWDEDCLPTLTGLVTGSAFSQNIRQCLTGTAAATATLAIVTVSGDDAANAGWTIDGDDLEHPGDAEGSGALRLRATHSGNSVLSAARSWAWSDPVVGDTTAPTVPTGLAGTHSGTQIVWTWNPSSDGDGTGVASYDLELDGSVVSVPASGGLASDLTCTNVGSSTPTPSDSRDGNDYELSAGGAGNHGQLHQFLFCYRAVSGPFTASVRVSDFDATVDQYSSAGIAVYDTLDTTNGVPKFFHCAKQSSDNSIQAKSRTATGANATNKATHQDVGAGDPYIRLTYNGKFACDYSSDGTDFTGLISDQTVEMGDTKLVGLLLFSRTDGNAVSADFEGWTLSAEPTVSYQQATTQSVTARVRARDGADNVSAYTPTVTVSAPASEPPEGVKWAPGDYLKVQGEVKDPNYWTSVRSQISQRINASQYLKGAWFGVGWGHFNPTGTTYDFSQVDQTLDLIASFNKKAIIIINWKTFNTSADDNIGPADLMTSHSVRMNTNGSTMAVWRPQVIDRLIPAVQAFADRYDDDPRVALVLTEELTPSMNNNESGYTPAAYYTQMQRLIPAWGAAFSRTPTVGRLNSFCQYADDLMQLLVQSRMGRGDPDSHDTPGRKIWMGRPSSDGGGSSCHSAGPPDDHDYRKEGPHESVISSPNIGPNPKDATGTIAQTDALLDEADVHFRSWIATSTATGRTWADILARINSRQGAMEHDSDCPTMYDSCVTDF